MQQAVVGGGVGVSFGVPVDVVLVNGLAGCGVGVGDGVFKQYRPVPRVRFSDEGVGNQFVCGGADFAEADVCGMVPAGVAGQDGVALRGCGLFVAFPFGAGDAQLLDDMLDVVAAGC